MPAIAGAIIYGPPAFVAQFKTFSKLDQEIQIGLSKSWSFR
jgi:hypothetical protein